jgi:protein-S-isoprenylcysteine O-methyltransferase Ste14
MRGPVMVSIKLLTGTVALVLIQLGLAILGWGGFSPFVANPARVALGVATVMPTIAGLLSGGNLSPGEEEDRSNRWVIAAFALIGLLIAYLPAYSDRKDFLTLDGDAVRWLGVILFVAGGELRLWPVFVLGRQFSGLVAIQQGHTLVTTGIYGVIRHPSYLGLLVSTLGWGLTFRSVLGVVLTAMIVPVLVARIRSEENLLRQHFGGEYEAYCSRTPWRLIPWVC